MKIVFIGTPKFGSIILNGLISNNYRPVLVVTSVGKVLSEVKLTAIENNIVIGQLDDIKNINPDLIITASFGQIIDKDILDIPKYGSINVHPSLLPKYRGASPIQSTILNGDKEAGVSIYKMDEKMDHGPIFLQQRINCDGLLDYESLEQILADLAIEMLVKLIPDIDNLEPKEQDHSKATYTKIIKKQDGEIDWNKSAQEIERQIRAYHIWPTSFFFWNNKRIKVIKSDVYEKESDEPIGKALLSSDNELIIKCKNNFLKILELQVEGKSSMSSQEFLRGHKNIIHDKL